MTAPKQPDQPAHSDHSDHSDQPYVSVCITAYNLESYIAESIESVLSQKTGFQFEIIVHDDASTDGTRDIIRSFVDKYPEQIRAVYQEKNIYTNYKGGLGYMFNTYILPETRGTYIAICDGDDYWTDPYKLQKQIDFLENNPEASACVTNVMVITDKDDSTKSYNSYEEGFLPESKIIISGGSAFSASTLVFSKSKFMSSWMYPRYNEFSEYYEYDTIFCYCLLLAGKIGYLKESTAIYRRWHGGLYSGILHDPEKTSLIKQKEIAGNKVLIQHLNGSRKKHFKRKISVDSLHVLRNKSGLNRFRYFFNLNKKEIYKYVTFS